MECWLLKCNYSPFPYYGHLGRNNHHNSIDHIFIFNQMNSTLIKETEKKLNINVNIFYSFYILYIIFKSYI
jgi:hypothetical protein